MQYEWVTTCNLSLYSFYWYGSAIKAKSLYLLKICTLYIGFQQLSMRKKSNLTVLLIDFLKSHCFRFLSDDILPCSQYASLNLFAGKLASFAFSNHIFNQWLCSKCNSEMSLEIESSYNKLFLAWCSF